jgi:hypothetical protein
MIDVCPLLAQPILEEMEPTGRISALDLATEPALRDRIAEDVNALVNLSNRSI